MTESPFSILPGGVFYERPDLLRRIAGDHAAAQLYEKRRKAIGDLTRDMWAKTLADFQAVGEPGRGGFSVESGVVVTGRGDVTGEDSIRIRDLLHQIFPWRKGPWNIADHEVDAEWRSDLKFGALEPLYGDFRNSRILDIGSGNGYYAARMHALGAAEILCLDPSERFLLQFELFQKFARCPDMQLELLGYEEAPVLGPLFDVVLCMGVIYHQKSPLAVIEACRSALRPGGLLVLESMTYPSPESVAFFPQDRYAKARNVYFLPSSQAMASMCMRLGFKDVEVLNERPITVQEQRKTELAPWESLAEFLDPEDHSRTIEGHPAPLRAVVVGRKS